MSRRNHPPGTMKPEEFAKKAEQIFGGEWGWQSATARILDVGSRRVRAYISGKEPVPEGLARQIAAIHAAITEAGGPLPIDAPAPADSGPDWIIGVEPQVEFRDIDGPEYLVHLRRPRFFARIVDEALEGGALGREVYVDGDHALVVTWIDRPNDDDAAAVIDLAFEQLA